MPHDVPSHVAVPPLGVAQARHEVPQVIGLKLSTQLPEQSCVPVGHWPSHARFSAMQLPRQIFVPLGHFGWHWPETHSAVPPIGIAQGMHARPQLSAEASLTHAFPQRCWPAGHLQAFASQVAPVAQSIAVQQLVSAMQVALQAFVPGGHVTPVPAAPVPAATPAPAAPVPAGAGPVPAGLADVPAAGVAPVPETPVPVPVPGVPLTAAVPAAGVSVPLVPEPPPLAATLGSVVIGSMVVASAAPPSTFGALGNRVHANVSTANSETKLTRLRDIARVAPVNRTTCMCLPAQRDVLVRGKC